MPIASMAVRRAMAWTRPGMTSGTSALPSNAIRIQRGAATAASAIQVPAATASAADPAASQIESMNARRKASSISAAAYQRSVTAPSGKPTTVRSDKLVRAISPSGSGSIAITPQ